MDNYFAKTMSAKTDEELKEAIADPKSSPDAIHAAQLELKKRQDSDYVKPEPYFADNEVDDAARFIYTEDEEEETPSLYSPIAIFAFSFLMPILFGGIMMAYNLKVLKQNKKIGLILAFTLLYWIGTGLISYYFLPMNLVFVYLSNLLGAYILSNYFWKKFIGQTAYKPRAIWLPLLLVLSIVIIYLIWFYNIPKSS